LEALSNLFSGNALGKCPVRVISGEDNKINWKETHHKDEFDHYQDAFKSLTATTDLELTFDIIGKGAQAISGTASIVEKYNTALQTLADSAPRDSTEARLCLQANALYSQGMNYLARSNDENMIPQAEFYMKNATKLLRLHNETVEALNKYRKGGEQRMVIQHVNVNEGGKAIVGGQLISGGGGNNKTSEVLHD
jgi:hypothetical protein